MKVGDGTGELTGSGLGAWLARLLRADPLRWHLLGIVQSSKLPDCWIAAGFVRNAVWGALHGRNSSPLTTDVDVIYFDPLRTDPSADRAMEQTLHLREPHIRWSLKNQARMHGRNRDAPYASGVDAMRYWPETVTAIAVRRGDGTRAPDAELDIAAPFGLGDLLALVLRPTLSFTGDEHSLFDARVARKNWLYHWPKLIICDPDQPSNQRYMMPSFAAAALAIWRASSVVPWSMRASVTPMRR